MNKWFGIFAAVSLSLLLGTGIVVGNNSANSTKPGKICEEEGFLSQVLQSNGKEYVLYKSSEQDNFQVKKTEKDLYQYKTVGTLHSDGVYYLYQYESDGKTVFGIEPVEKEGDRNIGLLHAEGTFFAAGNSEEGIFVSILGNDGRTITEYVLDLEKETKEWRESMVFSLPQGHFAVAGEYDGEKLFLVQEDGKVYLRDEILKETGNMVRDTVLSDCFVKTMIPGSEKDWFLSCAKSAMVQYFIPVLLVAAMIVLLFLGKRKENHMIYQLISYFEIICMIGIFAAGLFFSNRFAKQKILETGVEAGYVLEEMKARQRVDGTMEAAVYWNMMERCKELLNDVIILQPTDLEVLMAKNIIPGMEVSDFFEPQITDIIEQVNQGNETIMAQLGKSKESYIVVTRDFTQIEAKSILLAVVSEAEIRQRTEAPVSVIWNVMWMLMIAITALHIIIFLVFNSKWQKFLERMKYVASEKQDYTERPDMQDGLHSAWAPLDRISQNIVKLRYEKDLLYRNYYRFVPKGMEQLLRKSEVADIEIGDKSEIHGCLVLFRMENIKDVSDREYMDVMTDSLRRMHQIRGKYGGSFISAGGDLLERKVFFEQGSKDALAFAVEYYQTHEVKEKNNKLIMMLHEADYRYGITGVEDMMTPFIYCSEEKILDAYIDVLAKAKVKIVMTHQAFSTIGEEFLTRYIGFVCSGEMAGGIKLYECLDAYAEDKRKIMKESDVHFQKALQLFYSNDFYLARNGFNEVLKMNSEDEIARWYLFHCEYHLNRPETEVSYGLFERDVQPEQRHRL